MTHCLLRRCLRFLAYAYQDCDNEGAAINHLQRAAELQPRNAQLWEDLFLMIHGVLQLRASAEHDLFSAASQPSRSADSRDQIYSETSRLVDQAVAANLRYRELEGKLIQVSSGESHNAAIRLIYARIAAMKRDGS